MIINKITREQFLIKKNEIDSVIQILKSENEKSGLDDIEVGYEDAINRYLYKVVVYESKKIDILWNIVINNNKDYNKQKDITDNKKYKGGEYYSISRSE